MTIKLKHLAAPLFAAAMVAGIAHAQQKADNLNDIARDVEQKIGPTGEVIVSSSSTATPEDSTILKLDAYGLTNRYTFCDGNTSKAVETMLGISMTDLTNAASKVTGEIEIELDLKDLASHFQQALDNTVFVKAPEDFVSEHSDQGKQYHYHFQKMADEYEAETGFTVSTLTVIYDDPHSSCGTMRFEDTEMFQRMTPEEQKKLLNQMYGNEGKPGEQTTPPAPQ